MSDRRVLANRTNASKSTGPTTDNGKAIACQNATRHGLRSARLLVDGEDPNEYQMLQSEMLAALKPVGAIELAIAERIVSAVWRQRRLAKAESAAIEIERRDDEVLDSLRRLHDYEQRDSINAESLLPFDEEQAAWYQAVLDEVEALDVFALEEIEGKAPILWQQVEREAEEDNEDPATFLETYPDGVAAYVTELCSWCRKQLTIANDRPRLLALATHLRKKKLVLPENQLQLFARYQTTLDNQLYKALRAFREAQDWRLKTLDVADREPGLAPIDEVA